jgi:ABC-type multidrug transport system ATPase subunit
MKVVRIEHVYKDYQLGDQKVQALKDITLSFDPGVFLAIAGPSGSGKTTLLNLIGCIDTPTSGKILHQRPGCQRSHARSTRRSARPDDRVHLPDLQSAAGPVGRRKRRISAASPPGCFARGTAEASGVFPG